MPANRNTIGRDISVVLVTPRGELNVAPEAITGWSSNRRAVMSSRKGMAGPPRHRQSPDGWEGSFSIDRFDSGIEDHFIALDEAYYRGENTYGGTIQETINNPDGSVSQYRYTGVELNLTSVGDRSPDDEVAYTVEFMASQKIRVV